MLLVIVLLTVCSPDLRGFERIGLSQGYRFGSVSLVWFGALNIVNSLGGIRKSGVDTRVGRTPEGFRSFGNSTSLNNTFLYGRVGIGPTTPSKKVFFIDLQRNK